MDHKSIKFLNPGYMNTYESDISQVQFYLTFVGQTQMWMLYVYDMNLYLPQCLCNKMWKKPNMYTQFQHKVHLSVQLLA